MTYMDPGSDRYEQVYQDRVLHNLHRRAKQMGFALVRGTVQRNAVGVSWNWRRPRFRRDRVELVAMMRAQPGE